MQDGELSEIERQLYVERTAQRLIDTCTITGGTLRLRFLGRPGGDFSFVLDFPNAELDNARGITASLQEVAGGSISPPKFLPKEPLPWVPAKFSVDTLTARGRYRYTLNCGTFELAWESESPIID